jgi:diguanylate cyclase (GGDEF)-like protein
MFLRALIVCVFAFFSTSVYAVATKNILMLHSYHQGMTWEQNIDKAIEDVLKPKQNGYVVYTEYMDTKRYHGEKYFKIMKNFYANKYKDVKFDIILSSDNNAFDFLKKYRNELFGKVPVVFCGVNNFTESMLQGVSGFTGVTEEFSDVATLQLMLDLHPNLKKVYVVNDYLVTGRAWKKDMEKHFQSFDETVKIEYAKNLPLEQLKVKINSLDKDTAVLLGAYFSGKNNHFSTYEQISNYLFSDSKVPVYCLLHFNVSGNIIGGWVIGGYSQGETMAKIALKILHGEDINNIAVSRSHINKAVFNYPALKKYNIKIKMLPRDAEVINKPFLLYKEYKTVLLDLVYIFLILFIVIMLILILFVNIKKRNNKARDEIFISIIRYFPIIIVPIVGITIVWFFIDMKQSFYEEAQKLEEKSYIEQAKQQSKDAVQINVKNIKARLKLVKPKDLEKEKEKMLGVMQQVRYGENGYLIVADNKDNILVHIDKKLLAHPIRSNKKLENIFSLVKEVVKNQKEGFVTYNFINPITKKEEKKLTYVSYIPELGWYVASGVYLDTLHEKIALRMKELNKGNKEQIFTIIMLSITLLMIALVFSFALSHFLKKIFKGYKNNILVEHERANTDPLTNIHNRGSIMNILYQHHLEHNTTKKPLSLVMFDIDHFKKVNDTYGHDIGDIVLQKIAHFVKSSLRNGDSLGRYGGEEFYIVLPDTDLNAAVLIAQRLREQISKLEFLEVGHVTVSMGVVTTKIDEPIEDISKRVDELLYKSKADGRNRVSF